MKALCILLILLSSSESFPQGAIQFKTSVLFHPEIGQPYHALAQNAAGSPLGPEFSAGLYLVAGPSESLRVVTTFRDTGPYRGEVLQPAANVVVPGVPIGQQANFRVKVWETAAGSYDNAVQNGFCTGIFPSYFGDNLVPVVLGPRISPLPIPPAQLHGLLPLTLDCIPEPSTKSIALLAAFLLFRRRSRRHNSRE